MDISFWPWSILALMIFFDRHYLRYFCCECKKHFRFERSVGKSGDSGDICPKCLKIKHPDAYDHMKENGLLTDEQIAEAESDG